MRNRTELTDEQAEYLLKRYEVSATLKITELLRATYKLGYNADIMAVSYKPEAKHKQLIQQPEKPA